MTIQSFRGNEEGAIASPATMAQAGTSAEGTSAEVSLREGDRLRHILLGRPAAVRQTIHLLHHLRYGETIHWSPLIAIPHEQLIIPVQPEEVMSLLTRHLL